MKINSIEEAVRLFEENARIQSETFENCNYKLGNKCFIKYMKCIVYLYEHQALHSLIPLLQNEVIGVRYVAAYALLPIDEKRSIKVLKEIDKGDNGFVSINAHYTIEQWKKGEIIFPYQEGFHW